MVLGYVEVGAGGYAVEGRPWLLQFLVLTPHNAASTHFPHNGDILGRLLPLSMSDKGQRRKHCILSNFVYD